MKQKIIMIAALMITLLCGCSDKKTLHIYTWADYIDPEFVTQFEKENDCKVVIDTFDSNETMFAKLMASGNSGYDICCPTEYYIQILKDADLIEKLNTSKLKNVVNNFDKRFLNKYDRLEWHIPYAFSCTGILYRKDKFPNATFKKWDDMFTSQYIGRICMLNDIREIIGIALKQNGYSVNSVNMKELSKAVDTVLEWKKTCKKMDNESYKVDIANSTMFITMGYNSDAIQLVSEMPDEIGFAVPDCGTTSSIDTFVVMKSAPQKELAYKFLNALFERNAAIKNSEYICAPMLIENLAEGLSDEAKSNPFMVVTDDMLKKCENILDVGDNLVLYNKAWDEIKKVSE